MILATNGKHRRGKKRSKNPHIVAQGRRGLKRRSRNPRHFGGSSIGDVIKVGIGAAGGAVATRGLTQAVLGAKNQGVIGYLSNGVVALGLGWLTGLVASAPWSLGVTGGGLAATILRIWSERVAQSTPPALSGLGDLDFAGDGMGDFVETDYALPSNSVQDGRFFRVKSPWPQQTVVALPAAPAAGAAAQAAPAAAPAASAAAAASHPVPWPGHRLASRFPQAGAAA